MINLVPSAEEWPQIDFDPILPPTTRVQVGRPKKARKRGADEPRDANKLKELVVLQDVQIAMNGVTILGDAKGQ